MRTMWKAIFILLVIIISIHNTETWKFEKSKEPSHLLTIQIQDN